MAGTQQVDNQAGSPSHETSHSFGRVARSYIIKEWPNAVLVAAVVFIIHHYFHWLEAVDGYAFMGIGQFGFVATPKNQERVVALLIDPVTHENRYLERSPLSRCALYDDLQHVYESGPDLVAIDIDISPANWKSVPRVPDSSVEKAVDLPEATPWQAESDCENDLYRLIECAAPDPKTVTPECVTTTPKDKATTTVIMAPFKVSESWQKRMKDAGVKFGTAELPIDYGLVINRPGKEKKKVSAAPQKEEHEFFDEQVRKFVFGTPETQGRGTRSTHIDPRKYAEVKSIFISELDKKCGCQKEKNKPVCLPEVIKNIKVKGQNRSYGVVFFGAAYGNDDLFMTPIGEVYGVEVQAASSLSEGLSEHKGRDFLVDIALAIAFGIWIAYCWNGYFNARFSNNARHRQLARLWIIVGLVSGVSVMIIFVTFVSLILLAYYAIWSSPIPIAIGMLFDSFVSGSIDQAVHSSEHAKQSLIGRIKIIATEPAVQLTLEQESHQQSREPKNVWDSLRRVFGGDFLGLWARRKFLAAGMLGAWSLVWLFFTGWVIKICLTN